jgi:hypothetical protein
MYSLQAVRVTLISLFEAMCLARAEEGEIAAVAFPEDWGHLPFSSMYSQTPLQVIGIVFWCLQ